MSVQLVSKISNLCDPDPSTSQTDGRTDRQTDGRPAISIPCYALVHRAVKTELSRQLSRILLETKLLPIWLAIYCYFQLSFVIKITVFQLSMMNLPGLQLENNTRHFSITMSGGFLPPSVTNAHKIEVQYEGYMRQTVPYSLWIQEKIRRSSAVAVIADCTAYDIQHNGKPSNWFRLQADKWLVHTIRFNSRVYDHIQTQSKCEWPKFTKSVNVTWLVHVWLSSTKKLTFAFSSTLFLCILWLNDTSYGKSVWRDK